MDGNKLLDLYRQMYLMRRFEEEAARAYTEQRIGGFLHLYIGQEAVGAGVIAATNPEDYIVSAYRLHGHFLARGASARSAMAELFGKASGACKGRGGSMHFFSAKHNFLGGHGIVGAHLPIATGAAFASKYRRDGRVTICFFGEGAVNIGPFHEALCLATLWKLPVVFVIENNFYAMGTPLSRSLVTEEASIRALGYPLARRTEEGVDVLEVYQVAQEAIKRAREDSLPMLLEFKTYRYRGHSMADPGKYRSKEEVEDWKMRDPLNLVEERIIADYPEASGQIKAIQQSVEEEIKDAVQFAEQSPEAAPKTLFEHTYVD